MIPLALTVTLVPLLQDPTPPSRTIEVHAAPIEKLAVSPDGTVLVTVAAGEMVARDLKKDEVLWKASLPNRLGTSMAQPGAKLPVVALDVGEELVAYHVGMAWAAFVDLEQGEARTGIGGPTAMQDSRCLVIDPKDRWLWIGTDSGVVSRVVPNSANSWSNRGMQNGGVTCLALDAKGKSLAVGGEDATVRFVGGQSANRDEKKVLEGHPGPVTAVAMDPKGALVLSASTAGDLRLWKFSSGKPLAVLHVEGDAITHLAIDPKGKLAASGDDNGVIRIWNLKKRKLQATLPAEGEAAVSGLAFIDKETLASSRTSPAVVLWDLSDI